MSEKFNDDMVNGTRKTSFFLGLTSGIAGASVLALVGLFALLLTGQGTDKNNGAVANQPTNNQVVDQPVVDEPAVPLADLPAISGNDYVKGGANAKVTLIEYSDFECPYCSKHYETMKKIAADYGDKIKVVFRHFPLSFHPEAQKAAEASECAGEQGKFWEMHDNIFDANLAGTMSLAKWKEEAKGLGLDTKKFDDCLDSGKYAQKVADVMDAGAAAGVEGTPATFINGELVSGAVPYDQLKGMIDAQL